MARTGEDSDDTLIVVCVPTARARYVVPGSTVGHCQSCLTEVYVSPSSHEQMRTAETVIINCIECGLARAKAEEQAKLVPLTHQQIAEIRERLTDGR